MQLRPSFDFFTLSWRFHEPLKNINVINDLPPRFTLIKSMACGLALLASGQAFAVDYYSKSSIVDADLANPAKWNTDMCDPGGAPATGTTISLGNSDLIYVCPGHSVTLTSATFAVGKLMFSDTTTTWGGGTLKFSAGNKKISNENPSLPQIALNISSMTTGDQIIIDGGTNSITFSGVTGGTLDCGGPYTPGDSISPWTACTVTVTGGGGGGGAVSAPIDLNMNKPVESYSTDIELK